MSFQPEQMLLSGRRALVTGGTGGIGNAIAVAFAQAGADVAITYRRTGPDRKTVNEMKMLGRTFHACQCDLAQLDKTAAEAIVDETNDALGGIDILVNNAGTIHRESAVDHDAAKWREVLAVGLDAAFHLSQAAGRRMVEQGFGRIVNMGSILSFQGGILVPSYATAKHGLLGLTRALCNEWASHGVTVNAVAPGYIQTDMTEAVRADTARSDAILSRIPAQRWGRPKDVAAASVFLASDMAEYINGQAIGVDGGWMAR